MTSIRQTRCSLCAEIGHNMTTCTLLSFRQDEAHTLYANMWQKWLQMYDTARLGGQTGYYDIAQDIERENERWLKKPLYFRLLKSYLNLVGRGTDQEIRDYMVSLYRYLVIKKNGLFPHIITNPHILGIRNRYANYDYLLDTIQATLNTRQYGIIVQHKTTSNDDLLEACAICYEDYAANNFVKTNCEHSFCQNCVTGMIQILPENKKLSCPMCRSNINHLSCYTSIITNNLKNILNL